MKLGHTKAKEQTNQTDVKNWPNKNPLTLAFITSLWTSIQIQSSKVGVRMNVLTLIQLVDNLTQPKLS